MGRFRRESYDTIYARVAFLSPVGSFLVAEGSEESVCIPARRFGKVSPVAPEVLKGEHNQMRSLRPKRRVFVSHYKGDRIEVDQFIKKFGGHTGVFTPRVLGAGDNYDYIDSTDTNYVMSQIRDRYLRDSTVTIVLVGRCTHGRRYIDWEIKSSLTQASDGLPNGLLAIQLRSASNGAPLPERFKLNWKSDGNCYARFRPYPGSDAKLATWIEDAFQARKQRSHLIKNPQGIWKRNRCCEVHKVTH